MIPPLTEAEIARFHSKVEHGVGCWLWCGTDINNQGYGRFVIYRGSRRTRILAHKLAFFFATGEDPGSDVVRHDCDTPLCCAPTHLRRGSQQENMQDAVTRGRMDTSGLAAHRSARDAAALERLTTRLKCCCRCKVVKPFEAFYRNRGSIDGRAYVCKDCNAVIQREYKERRKLKRRAVAA